MLGSSVLDEAVAPSALPAWVCLPRSGCPELLAPRSSPAESFSATVLAVSFLPVSGGYVVNQTLVTSKLHRLAVRGVCIFCWSRVRLLDLLGTAARYACLQLHFLGRGDWYCWGLSWLLPHNLGPSRLQRLRCRRQTLRSASQLETGMYASMLQKIR